MEAAEIYLMLEEKIEQAVAQMLKEFGTLRTGKASPALIDSIDIEVKAYGSRMKLKELAVVSVPEPRMLFVNPFDPSTSGDIEKGIQQANLGLNPVNEGKGLRVVIPELTNQRRQEINKKVKEIAEETKIRTRSTRKEALDITKKMKANKEQSEDAIFDINQKIQQITDDAITRIDKEFKVKEAEILTI